MGGEGPGEQHYSFAPTLESILLAQEKIEAAASGFLDKARMFRLNMAVEELLTNVVKHSGTTDPMTVTIRDEPGCLSVELGDSGPRFDPFTQAQKPVLDASIEDRPIGGLGVHLVQAMLDKVEYRRIGERNSIVLTMFKDGSKR